MPVTNGTEYIIDSVVYSCTVKYTVKLLRYKSCT